MIKFQDVSFRYRDTDAWVIDSLNLTIKENQKVAIIGKNGSGKSTIAKLISGLLLHELGHIYVENDQLTPENLLDIRKKIGMVFQNPENQFVGMTVKEDIAFGLENRGVKREVMLEKIVDILEQVSMLEYIDREPQHLSGGQKQRIAIASAMVLEPKILILDEATSMLDPVGRKEMMSLVETLHNRKPFTLLMITHELNEAILADRIIVIEKGKVVLDGTPRELFTHHIHALDELGFPAPYTIQLAKGLEKNGFSLDPFPLDQEELISALWKLHLKR